MSSPVDRRILVPWGLLLVAAGLLFANGGRYLSAQTTAQIAIGGLLLLTLMLPKARPYPWRWGMLLLLPVAAASYWVSANQVASIEELCRWATYFAVAYMAWRTADELPRAQLCLAITGLGTLAAAGGLTDVLVHRYDVAASFLSRSNDLAAYLLLTLPLSLVLSAAEARSWRTIGRLAFTMQLLALVLTQSRAAFLAAGVGMVLLFLLSAGVQRLRMAITVAGTVLIGGIVAGPQLLQLGSRFGQLLQALLGSAEETSTPWRAALLRAAVRIGQDHPWLGTGPGTYSTASRAYQDTAGFYSINAHNFYLQLWAEVGALGVLAWGVILGGVIVAIWQVRQLPAEIRTPSAALAAGVGASLVHIAFDIDWSVLAIPILFWLMAGMLLRSVSPAGDDLDSPSPALGRVARLALALVLIVLPVRTAIASQLHLKANRAFAKGEVQTALELYQKAERALPGTSASWANDRAQALVADGQLDAAMEAVQQARQLDPFNGAYPMQAAILHARLGAMSDAIADARTAIELNPYRHPSPYVTLASWLEGQGQIPAAVALLYQAKERFPAGQLFAYEEFTPGDRYELLNAILKLADLERRQGHAAAATEADAYFTKLLGEQIGSHGLTGPQATPTGTIEAYWQAYAAGSKPIGILPGAKVPAPPEGLPAGPVQWRWFQRDRETAQVIYERAGVPVRIVDELELRDAGWYIVRRRGLANDDQAAAPIQPAARP